MHCVDCKDWRPDIDSQSRFGNCVSDKFKEGQPVKDVLPVVVRAVDSAMKRDIASGNNYDIAVISKDEYRSLSTEEKKAILGGS